MMPSRRLVTRLLLIVGLALCLLTLACNWPPSASGAGPTAWPVLPERPAVATLTVYGDALDSAWGDWSWGGVDPNLANATPHHGATGTSISVHFTGGYRGLQFCRASPPGGRAFDTLRFWVKRGPHGGRHPPP